MADVTDVEDGEIERLLQAHGPFEKPPQLKESDRIGDWNVLAFLGRGGSAEVYRAENLVTGIFGAVKVLYRSDDKARARFKREAQLASELSGAAFPKFYGAGEDSGRLYIAEEILESAELPRRDAAVARYVLEVACAVEELHGRGFIHRDIKPSNVMVRPATGEHVLIDLGLAKEEWDSSQSKNDTLSVVDGHAVGVGTPGFSAPEQFEGGEIGAAADIHALGVLANVCFNGKPPRAWIPIVRRSTSSIPKQRYATVAEFMRAVRRRHVARVWWILTALVLTITAFIVFLIVQTRPQANDADVEAKSEKAAVKAVAEALLSVMYEKYRDEVAGSTNKWGESIKPLDKKAAEEAMKGGNVLWL